jgi:surfactin synthase thioesterase subunit
MASRGPALHTAERPGRGQPRLFVFAHAGGSSLSYRGLAAALPSGWQVTALDAPGHGTRMGQPPLDDGTALVDHFLDLIGPSLDEPDVPFAFFGHSMGALVAHELTRRLADEGRRLPAWTGVSACGPPTGEPRLPAMLREVSDDELRERMVRLGGTPAPVLEQMWHLFAPIVRSDLRIVAQWHSAPRDTPLPVPLSVFGGARDAAVPVESLGRWAERCSPFLGTHVFPGGHFYFQDDPRPLADGIATDLLTALPARDVRSVDR